MCDECNGISVLVLDDEPMWRRTLERHISRLGHRIRVASTIAEAQQLLQEETAEVALIDLTLPDGNGADFVRWALARGLLQRAYCLTGDASRANIMDALRAGCLDVVEKPVDMYRISSMIQSGHQHQNETSAWRTRYAPDIIGEDHALLDALTTVACVAKSDCPVLVTGESGTGKELIARAIHEASDRRGRPFVALNCAAIPENLIESELFGHAKGAFTGATGPREGHILSADGGTLFLDEIGDMPLPAQAKLLRVLQEGKITPVGADKPIPVDIRVVAATNKNLDEQIEAKTFRGDLFYRIGVIRVELPPLRQRKDDILLLSRAFLRRMNAKLGAKVLDFDPSAEDAMRRYPWPGNIRELTNVVQRAVLLKREGVLSARDLRLPARVVPLRPEPESQPQLQAVSVPPSAPQLQAVSHPETMNLKSALDELERQLIQLALERTSGNRTEAATLLGLNRTTLVEKLRKISS